MNILNENSSLLFIAGNLDVKYSNFTNRKWHKEDEAFIHYQMYTILCAYHDLNFVFLLVKQLVIQ